MWGCMPVFICVCETDSEKLGFEGTCECVQVCVSKRLQPVYRDDSEQLLAAKVNVLSPLSQPVD